MNTFSKTLSPSFRLSYMILPDSLIKLFKKKMSFYSCQVPSLEQKTLSEFISGGFYEKHLNRMKNYYRGIRNELILSLEKSPLNRISEIHEEEAGLHFLLKIKTDKSEAYLKKRMEEEGIMIHTLSDFYHTKENKLKNIKCTFIINYTGLNRDKIRLAVEKLSEAVL